tara:strand:+ start:47 stop:232 length:186 start_codon:yes stop_codon:yes gene_type:complete
MTAVETVALVKGSDTVVVNAGSAQEANFRAQGYKGEDEKPAKRKTSPGPSPRRKKEKISDE